MNQDERENIERFEKIQDNISELRSREIRKFLEEFRIENNIERSDKILKTIRYHQYDQQQYLIWFQENTKLRFPGLVMRTYDPNERIIRKNPEQSNN